MGEESFSLINPKQLNPSVFRSGVVLFIGGASVKTRE